MRGADVVQDARRRLEHGAVAGALQTTGEIDILEIAAERFGKQADLQERGSAIEAARRAGAEDGAWLGVGWAWPFAVAAFLGEATSVIAVAGAVDGGAVGPGKHHGGDGSN